MTDVQTQTLLEALMGSDEAPSFKMSTVAERNYLVLEDLVGDAVSFTLAEAPAGQSSTPYPLI